MASPHYAGARGRLQIRDLERLGSRFRVQPKLDGVYAQVHLDGEGRIFAIYSRAGRRFSPRVTRDLVGLRVGWPGDVLVGELEAYTEASQRAIERRGYPLIHVFDALRVRGQDLRVATYAERRHALHSARVRLPDISGWGQGRDRCGRLHDMTTGRYVEQVPRGWRRCPIVEQWPLCHARQLWERAQEGELEGLVVVAQGARLGQRRAKRKVKPVDTLDAHVLQMEPRRLVLKCAESGIFLTGRPRNLPISEGAIVEVAHEGWHPGGDPRFPRVKRVRWDLMDTAAQATEERGRLIWEEIGMEAAS